MRQACSSVLELFLFSACVPEARQIPTIPASFPRTTRGDIGRTFATIDEAALAACEYLRSANPAPKRWEYAGCIYGEQGQIKVGLPETIESATFCMVPEAPRGAIYLADYHDHPTKEDFSELDVNTRRKTPQYLCTPSGAVRKRTTDGKITRLK